MFKPLRPLPLHSHEVQSIVSELLHIGDKALRKGSLSPAGLADEERLPSRAELSRLGREYVRDPDKKITLLTWLREHHAGAPAAEVEAALVPLLEDFSDDVRIQAARGLAAAAHGEQARDALIALLLRDRDNARVRGEVFEALATMGADVKGHRPSVEALLVPPFYLDREGRVKKQG